MTTNTVSPAPSFVGDYVTETRDVIVASVVSGVHALLIGAPGWGKTGIVRSVVETITDGAYVFLRLDASTPPEKVAGAPDPAIAMNEGKIVPVRTGTVYDPDAKVIILDELGRPMDPVFDILLDALDRQDVDPEHAPVCIGTTNFMPKSERVQAVLDRIPFWNWVQPGALDVDGIVGAQLDATGSRLSVVDSLPSWQDVEAVRAARPGPAARAAVIGACNQIASEANAAQGGMFQVNPRRLTQWQSVLYRTSVFYYGTEDFITVHPKAKAVLKWCWPTTSLQMWTAWNEIANAAADPIKSAVNGMWQMTYEQVQLMRKNNNDPTRLAFELGKLQTEFKRNMRDLVADNLEFKGDPRVAEALQKSMDLFSQMVNGEDPADALLI